MNTPILLLIFNRPNTTERVFQAIRKIKPQFLYVAADGPRLNKEGEIQKCEQVKKIIDEGIDWPCIVKKLYRENNLGCGIAVSNAINWFFDNEEMGIILEDDTLPNESFFEFCATYLEKFKNEEKILHISGSNYAQLNNINETFYFTHLPFIWGWATWRRAWRLYDFNYKNISLESKGEILANCFTNNDIIIYWKNVLKDFHAKPESYTWDYQWLLTVWHNNGLVIQPSQNLTTNIGFDENATHTLAKDHYLANIPAYSLKNQPAIFTRFSIKSKS